MKLIQEINQVRALGHLWTPTNLSLVAESRDDNVRSNDLHEELNDDEHDRKELFCNACRWNN